MSNSVRFLNIFCEIEEFLRRKVQKEDHVALPNMRKDFLTREDNGLSKSYVLLRWIVQRQGGWLKIRELGLLPSWV